MMWQLIWWRWRRQGFRVGCIWVRIYSWWTVQVVSLTPDAIDRHDDDDDDDIRNNEFNGVHDEIVHLLVGPMQMITFVFNLWWPLCHTILQIHICGSSSVRKVIFPLPNNNQEDQGYYFDRNGALVGLVQALGHLLLLSIVEITRWAKSPHRVQSIASKTTATRG